MRTIGIIIVLLLWILMGWKMCTDYTECCPADQATSETTSETTSAIATSDGAACANGFICFADNSCEPSLGNTFTAFRDSIRALLTDDRVMRITGIYNSSESYDGSAANLGACRAGAIRQAFGSLNDDQVLTGGQIVVGREVESTDRFLIEILDRTAPSETEISESANTEDESGDQEKDSDARSNISTGADAVIYFPFNSTDKLDNASIETYLRQIAERVKGTNQRIRLTGHTDDIGGASSNLILGQRRAVIVAEFLINEGVPRNQIITESKGETQPVASNATEEGRARNRRTELKII